MTRKEQEILLAAENEFLEKGYDAASTAVIAKAAGVTHAMVNYYYRSKENLFSLILDNHIHDLLSALKPLMNADRDIVGLMTDVALAIFDKMNENRKFPYLLQDIARTHPEFFLKYHETFSTTCMTSIGKHSARLESYIEKGIVSQCTMMDICDTVFTLATAPFLNIPLLKNVAKYTDEQVDKYILVRRSEMEKVIRARYSC